MSLRSIIVDDELPACAELSHLLGEIDGIDVISVACDGISALDEINLHHPDVVFLDIRMPRLSGFDIARKLVDSKNAPRIVFTTAYEEYAAEAFEMSAIDYVLKPFSRERLEKTVGRLVNAERNSDRLKVLEEAVHRLSGPNSAEGFIRIAVIEKGRIIFLSPKDVFFCKASQGSSNVFTRDRSFHCSSKLDKLEVRLKGENFFRVHRSFLVNMEHIRDMVPFINGKYLLTMKDNSTTEIPVSRKRIGELKAFLPF